MVSLFQAGESNFHECSIIQMVYTVLPHNLTNYQNKRACVNVYVWQFFTIVAVKGILSIREEAKAETHMTRMMAMASRSASGTAWQRR